MQIQFSFLKGISIICLSLFFLVLSCGSDVYAQTAKMQQTVTDVLTHVLTIGGEAVIYEKSQEEFYLSKPYSIAVNNANDILVLDEDRIKVFDEYGRPKKIVGRPGQGPGEFNGAHSLWISPAGYIAVLGGFQYDIYSAFTPDYKFIEMIRLQSNAPYQTLLAERDMKVDEPELIITLNETDRLYNATAQQLEEDKVKEDFVFLIYQTEDAVDILADYKRTNVIRYEILAYRGKPHFGSLMAAMLTNNRVVYTHTFHETEIDENLANYKLFVLSLDNLKKIIITHPFNPVVFIKKEDPSVERMIERSSLIPELYKRLQQKIYDVYDERKYKSPLQSLMTDRNYIFAFTFEKNKEEEIFADVFNADTGKYIKSAYFPFIPNTIKNGYAYNLKKTTETEFAEIKKYRIDPAVYGK